MTKGHLLINFNFQDFGRDDLQKEILGKIYIPDNKFPPRFFSNDENFLIGGYFVSYYPKITIKELISLCKKRDWKKIAELNADFIIVVFDYRDRKIQILTDQSGKFPCYYHLSSKGFFLSTSFFEVMKKLTSPTLDVERALEFIYRDTSISTRTFIREISFLPPATLLEIKDGRSLIQTQLNPNKFLDEPFEKFDSLQSFSNEFLRVLDESVKDRIAAVEEFNFGADLSSGFDSPLINFLLKKNSKRNFISYCEIAKDGTSDTDPDIVADFARKHNLNVKFIKYDSFFPFSTKVDLGFIEKGPSHIQKSQLDFYLKQIRKDNNLFHFTGEGGDEIYWSSNDILDLEVRFPKQIQYFQYNSLRKYGIDKILTDKGTSFLLDKDRFRAKKFLPIFIPSSVAHLFIISFELHWEDCVWPLTPFADTRLVQLARGIPSKGINKLVLKQRVWESRKDIFVEGNFREKGGTEKHYGRFLLEKRDFVLSLLRNSQLGAKGWVRSSEIINDILEGKQNLYYEGDIIAYLTNLLEIEYFIQKNRISVL